MYSLINLILTFYRKITYELCESKTNMTFQLTFNAIQQRSNKKSFYVNPISNQKRQLVYGTMSTAIS